MILQVNVQQVLQRLDPNIKALREWDKLIVASDDDSAENFQQVLAALRCIPGIQYILDVQVSSFDDAQHITQLTKQMWQHQRGSTNSSAKAFACACGALVMMNKLQSKKSWACTR